MSESWRLPITHTRKQMAECQKQLQKIEEYPSLIISVMSSWNTVHVLSVGFFNLLCRYLQTSALLASDANLSDDERKHFCQEILTFASQTSEFKGKEIKH